MWGKPETQPTQRAPQPAGPPPLAGAPAALQQAPSAARTTILGKTMKILGDVVSEEELYIDGELEGKLELKGRLTIGPESKVNANIKAKEVIVFGAVRGNVDAEERIALRAGATIVGDIKTAGIIIEDGAYFKGGIDISKSEPKNEAKGAQRSHAAGADPR